MRSKPFYRFLFDIVCSAIASIHGQLISVEKGCVFGTPLPGLSRGGLRIQRREEKRREEGATGFPQLQCTFYPTGFSSIKLIF